MPWSPPSSERPERDERVEARHDQLARLVQSDGREADLFCRVDTAWTLTSGHLWWRWWAPPHYRLELYLIEDDQMIDLIVVADELKSTLDDFDEGVFLLNGQRWDVHWLGDEASERFRREGGWEDYVR